MFRFADTDMRNLLADIKPIDESIHKTLRASVPGLITGEVSNPLDESLAASGRHRNLIPSHAFNVTTLFQPTVAFIERAASVAPSGFEEEPKAFGAVLEDFVVRVFLPQLDERVNRSFQSAVSGYDAYQLDRSVTDTDKPPLKVSPIRVAPLTAVERPGDGLDSQPVPNVANDAVPPGELQPLGCRSYRAVLSTMQHALQR